MYRLRNITHAIIVDQKAAEGHMIADKRPNPKQRKKKLKAIPRIRSLSRPAPTTTATTTTINYYNWLYHGSFHHHVANWSCGEEEAAPNDTMSDYYTIVLVRISSLVASE
jgi:hypothetical protein